MSRAVITIAAAAARPPDSSRAAVDPAPRPALRARTTSTTTTITTTTAYTTIVGLSRTVIIAVTIATDPLGAAARAEAAASARYAAETTLKTSTAESEVGLVTQ